MHLLNVYSFHKVGNISRMHSDLDNVLDWNVGSSKRKVEMQAQDQINRQEETGGVEEAPPAAKRKRGWWV